MSVPVIGLREAPRVRELARAMREAAEAADDDARRVASSEVARWFRATGQRQQGWVESIVEPSIWQYDLLEQAIEAVEDAQIPDPRLVQEVSGQLADLPEPDDDAEFFEEFAAELEALARPLYLNRSQRKALRGLRAVLQEQIGRIDRVLGGGEK